MNQQQQQALSLLAGGFKLTTLNGKKPIIHDWVNNPIAEHHITSHFDNFGILTGHGFFVFDVDDVNAFIMFMMENGYELPIDTLTVNTGRDGLHYYFLMPEGMGTMRNAVRIGKTETNPKGFADIRATGGQVVAPGSIHPDTGKAYSYGSTAAIAACPVWLVELLNTHNVKEAYTGERGRVAIESDDVFAVDRARQFLEKCEAAIEGQAGDHATFAASARCRDLGLSEAKTLDLMLEYFNPRCQPEWTVEELEQKIANAYRYSQGEQGSANPLGAFQSLGMSASAPVPDAPKPEGVASPANPVTTPAASSHVTGIDPFMITVGCGYTKNHTENSTRFLQENYPAKTLVVYKEDFYYFDGKSYVATTAQDMKTGLTFAMANATPSDSDINGALSLVKALSNRPVKPGEYAGRDSTGLILLQNGILDITTDELLPHSRDYFSTNILPYDYDPSAVCPRWDAFLRSTFEGDEERINFVEEWLGYMMVRDYSYQKIAMFIGVQRSGKTTISNIAKLLVGETNYMGIGLEGFAADGTLESALDRTVLWVNDAGTISGPNRSKIVDQLKTISGNGDISCSRKYKSAFSGRIPGRISITCNNVLAFNDDSGALAGRFVICPFNKSFFGQEDPTLERDLANELPGIANRCITALRRLRARGRFLEPSIAESERESITYRYSPVLAFINDECVLSDEQRVHGDQLYARYKMWCLRSGAKPIPQRVFVDAIRSSTRGKTVKKVVSINGVKLQGFAGLGLVPNDEPDNVAPIQGALV